MNQTEPLVEESGAAFSTVEGIFYRAADPAFPDFALAGSRTAGRFSPPDLPTLYLSSSREGVAAAMIAHTKARVGELEVLTFSVSATGIADLRQRDAMAALGIDVDAAAAPWQEDVTHGQVPASWHVREQLVLLGAQGLIDPSRKRPGLWHLTLFGWNHPAEASVRPL